MDNNLPEAYVDLEAEADYITNFLDPKYDLEERPIPKISDDFLTPYEEIKKKLIQYVNNLTYFHINAGSIPKHYDEIVRLLSILGVDILGVSETFICEKTPKMLYEIPGYTFIHRDRTMKSRGGTGLYIKNGLEFKEIKISENIIQPEMCFAEIKCQFAKVVVGVIYKSPLISYTEYSVLTEVLPPIITGYEHHIIMGDFNVNQLKPDSSACKFFREHVLEPFDLTQLVTEPTRVTKSTTSLIDYLLVSYPENVKVAGVADIPGIADHHLVFCSYALKKPKFKPKIIVKRKMDNFNIEHFKNDIAFAPWGSLSAFDHGDLDNKITVIENIFRDIIDKHCPKVEIRVTHPPASAWLTPEIKQLQNDRDKYYSKFKKMKKMEKKEKSNDPHFKSKIQITENIYHQLRNKVTHAIRKSKIQVFDEKINKKLKQPKQFYHAQKKFNVVDSKNCSSHEIKISPDILNNSFLSNNNAEIDANIILQEVTKFQNKPCATNAQFNFSEVNGLEVIKAVKSIKTNATGIDDISSFFIKASIEHTADILADIINASFVNNFFPTRWKQAIVKPIPKISNPIKASDYRPISLLPAFSKIAEKIAAKQMMEFLKEHKVLDKLQSAYKTAHSTITALLTVTDDIYKALDDSEMVLLTLLDYSKAFDTANHKLIVAKLKYFGFQENALSWITSYLSNRSQMVRTDTDSDWKVIQNGVPQGSILGPLLFTVLVSDISDNITSGSYHTYADDVQWYLNFKHSEAATAFATANTVMDNIVSFSKNNFLKLNTDKTKYIIIGSQHSHKKLAEIQLPPLVVNGDIIERKTDVKNLGIIFDEHMFWTNYIDSIVSKAYGRLKQAYKFRNFLSIESRFNIIETYVLSLFNYGNILYQNISARLANKIQRVQNSCMRFVFGLRKYDHISHCFETKKTLNMENRRKLHSLILMHKISLGLAPEYLSEKIIRHSDIHTYNTRARENIAVPRANSTLRSNTFFISAPKLYNDILPKLNLNQLSKVSINTFREKCKKYLISQQFPHLV